jgi:AcrR family transcriptional regulator
MVETDVLDRSPMASRTAQPAARPAASAPAGWEERSVSRVLRSGRERVLARSRRLVQAAGELIAEGGFEGLTLRALLERTRLSRRAFYERFDGMDDLILAVFEQNMREGAATFRAELAGIDEPLERLRFIIETMVLRARSDAAVRLMVAMSREHLRLAEARTDDLERALEPLTAVIAEQLTLGMERGVVRRADALQLAKLVHGLVATTIHASLLSRASGAETRPEESAAALWEFCLRAVRADR